MPVETIVLQHVLPNEIFINVDGQQGDNGVSGTDGFDGVQGTNGFRGQPATNPTNGKHGDDVTLTLTCKNRGTMVHVHAITEYKELIWDQQYPLDGLPSIQWSSRGGKGGDGATGGNGGAGSQGKDGIDASQDEPGTDAQNGGNGESLPIHTPKNTMDTKHTRKI